MAQGLTQNRPRSLDEYEDYNLQSSYEIGHQSALSWWLHDSQRNRWPKLSCMAIDILSMPAMSDEVERVFSGARRTITWDRASLGVTNVALLECLKHWKLSGILKEEC